MQNNSSENQTVQPFGFEIVEDSSGERYLVRSQEDHDLDLAAGMDESETLRPGKYRLQKNSVIRRANAVQVSIELELDLDVLNHFRSKIESHESLEQFICEKLRWLMEVETGRLEAATDEKKAA
ncbi:MAG: hypothetical protein IPN69_03280 [Acidobacteria bacterium]|nr:hypothetical protein [Acidobacteriota bacterium]MBK8809737.1 hypothetical protein [Acidobacteriota bacterium]